MEYDIAIEFGQQAMLQCFKLVAPILTVGIVVAISVGLLQSITQIQDQSISFIAKFVFMGVALVVFLPWLIETFSEFCTEHFSSPPPSLNLRSVDLIAPIKEIDSHQPLSPQINTVAEVRPVE